MNESVYLIHVDPPSPEAHCTLDDGSAVLCQCDDLSDALTATAGRRDLHVVGHDRLSQQEARRVNAAFRIPDKSHSP